MQSEGYRQTDLNLVELTMLHFQRLKDKLRHAGIQVTTMGAFERVT
jgi:hypothetical protein